MTPLSCVTRIAMLSCRGCGLVFQTESALRRHRNSGRLAHSNQCRTVSSTAFGSGKQDSDDRFQDIPPSLEEDVLEVMWADDGDAGGGSVPSQSAIQVKSEHKTVLSYVSYL